MDEKHARNVQLMIITSETSNLRFLNYPARDLRIIIVSDQSRRFFPRFVPQRKATIRASYDFNEVSHKIVIEKITKILTRKKISLFFPPSPKQKKCNQRKMMMMIKACKKTPRRKLDNIFAPALISHSQNWTGNK